MMNGVRGLRDIQGGGGGNGGSPPDCGEQIKNMWNQVPYFTRFIFISTTGLYLSSFITTFIIALLYVSPIKVVYGFQIWRLLTGPFVHSQLLQLLFSLLSYLPTAMQQEKLDGTVKQIFRFFTTSLMIETLFVLICLILSFTVSQYFLVTPSIGLWPILFCDIVIECHRSPDLARGLCCLPIQIKSKYYPIVLILLFTVFFGLQIDLFVGFGVGYLYVYGYMGYFEVSTQKAQVWESKIPFKYIRQSPSFVATTGAAGGSSLPTFVRTAPPQQQSQSRDNQQSQSRTFSAFQGKGVKLGDGGASTLSSSSSTKSGPSSTKSSSTTDSTSKTNANVAAKSALFDAQGNFKRPHEIDDESMNSTREEGEGHDMANKKTKDGNNHHQSDYQQINQDIDRLRSIPYSVINDKTLAHQDFLFKLIIIGDTGVGKSCLLARIMDNDFKIEHQVTIGVEFGSFVTKIEDKIVKLQIWDTAGQESFRSITRIFYRGAHCVFLTYDITRDETFVNVIDWLKEVKQHASSEIVVYLIGNRCDLEDEREVTRERAIEFCKQYSIDKFFETSAKTGDHVEEVFSIAAKELYVQQKEQQQQDQEEDDQQTASESKTTNTGSKKRNSDSKAKGSGQKLKSGGKNNAGGNKKQGNCYNYQNQAEVYHRQIRRWLASKYCPCLAVFSSQTVRDILKKQASLSPAELLRPFSEVGNLNNISLQTCEKNQPFKLKNFKIDFVDSSKIDGYNTSDQSMLIDFIIQNSTPKKFSDSQNLSAQGQVQNLLSAQKDFDQLKRQLLSLLDYDKQDTLTPWFSKWKKQFLQTTKFTDHELLSQPIAFIYFISATEHDPLGSIDIIKRADNLPSLYKEGIYDDSNQNIQHFIMILNPTDNPKIFQDACDTVKQKYPINQIFEIPMTRSNPEQGGPEDLWSRHIDLDEQALLQELHMEQLARGRSFSSEDRLKIKSAIKRMVEKGLLPFIERKIKNFEVNIANTRKGLKNSIKMLWKKPERGENDGLKETFKMNKEELELRNLVDLAFVSQDYETALNNSKIPYNDFKKCKAFRHAASCQEIQTLSQLAFENNMANLSNFKEIDQMMENSFMLYHRSNNSKFLIRSALTISELYDSLEKYQESANYLLRIANDIKEQSVIVPLFQEQAAYKYLYMRQFRKFALYLILAGKSYEKLNLQNYSFNCFTIVHPFYQRHKGWNDIRFQLYSSLGRNSQNMGDINLAVQFFRNLLQLCCEFDHQQEQRNCLNEFLFAVQNWSSQKSINLIGYEGSSKDSEESKKAHIGQLNLPIIIEDSIEVFISSEKLYTNKPDQLINSVYISYPNTSNSILDDNQEYVIQQKAELNSANCPWKFMAKHLFEHMNDERRKNPDQTIAQDACQFNSEEINEFAIYDCSSRARKRDLTIKKARKAFVGESIVVKLLVRNPLMADININKIKLVCRYENSEEQKDTDFEQLERSFVLRSLETKEIILEIFPKKTGKFIIERIEWILFNVVSCAYQMVNPTDKDAKVLTQEELAVPKKLLEREMNFIYDVVDQSAELFAKIVVDEQVNAEQQNFIFTEFQQAFLQVQNQSFQHSMKNGYVVCSHPMIFGFSRMKIFDRMEGGGNLKFPLFLRASLMQSNEIKFLIRYEVEYNEDQGVENINKMSKYRFCRLVFNMESLYAFSPKRHVHLSTKKANEHIFNIQIVDNIAPGSFYQTPQIQAIEIINRKKLWTLKNKDEKGQFFIIIPHSSEDVDANSILKYNDSDQISSILDDEKKRNFFEQELNFVMTKFKIQPTVEEEEVDIVLQWTMPQMNKRGFYCLFKIPLLKIQKQLTEQQNKLQRQRAVKGKDENLLTSARELPMINPLHIAYAYEKETVHDFQGGQKPAIVNFSLSISNMIQSSDYVINCKVVALNEWSSLSNPSDVSEGNSFLWVGKTQHVIKKLQTNEIKRVDLQCAILKPGVYNLNRFRVVMIDDENSQQKHHFINEIKLPDDILITVADKSDQRYLSKKNPADNLNLIDANNPLLIL